MAKLTDESVLSFGKYKGKKLIDVPEEYLIWWYKENVDLINYVEDSIDDKKLE